MAKQILFNEEARVALKKGIDKLASAVRMTLGPRGRAAVMEKGYGAPQVTFDGVTVAKEIELEDPFQNMGAQLIKEAASKANDVAGDGTTTATLLAHAIVTEGMKNITAGANPMILKKGIEYLKKKEHLSVVQDNSTTVEYEVEDDDNLLSDDHLIGGEDQPPTLAPKTDLKKDSLVDLIEDLYTKVVELRRLVNND